MGGSLSLDLAHAGLEFADEALISAVRALRLAAEAMGALWIAIGIAQESTALIRAHLRGRTESFTSCRLLFSRYLSLALEFQLASDILSTSIAPSWPEIGQLGATAVIRTGLNYFLSREIRDYRERESSPAEGGNSPQRISPSSSQCTE